MLLKNNILDPQRWDRSTYGRMAQHSRELQLQRDARLRLAMLHISRRAWALVMVSSALQILSFPIAGPVPTWRAALCWFAVTPLLIALRMASSDGTPIRIVQGAALGYVSGIIWYLGNCYWIYETMHTYGSVAKPAAAGILLLFCLYLGLYHCLFGALIVAANSRLGKRTALMLSPVLWVAVELARARITGFPWDQLGITQVDNPLLTSLAPFTGAYGISFAIVAVNALWLALFWMEKRRRPNVVRTSGAVIALLLVFVGPRTMRDRHELAEAGTATLVQENLEVGAPAVADGAQLTQKQMLESFSTLSLYPPSGVTCDGIPEAPFTRCGEMAAGIQRLSTAAPTNLIVWPEAPNNFSDNDPEFREALSQLAQRERAPVIVGNIGVTPDLTGPRGYLMYNSAEFVAQDGTIVGRYDKMHLVPFGEYTPYKNLFFFAGSLLQDVGIFVPGKQRTMFRTGGHTYGVFICYESVFGDEVREYAQRGADVLVNISDDGWYGDTSAAWEHLNQVRMRAIENHRWILRSTNTGVTAVIDPYGQVRASVPRHTRTSLKATFAYEHDVTFYAAHGDLFAWLCVCISFAAISGSIYAGRRVIS